MKYVTYKGAIYSKVTDRIKALRALNRPYSLTTAEERLEMDNFTFWKVKCELIMLDTHEVYTGNAMRRYEKDHPFGSYPLEWAETIATARAIGKMGIGIDYSYACLEELSGLDVTAVMDREQAAKVEPDTKFTTEDMKQAIGQSDKQEPSSVAPPEVQQQIDKHFEKSKSEKLAEKLANKKANKVTKKTGGIIPIPVDDPIPEQKPGKLDKIDSMLHNIESTVRDPVFDDEPEIPKPVVEEKPWPKFDKQPEPQEELPDVEIPDEFQQDDLVEDDESSGQDDEVVIDLD